MELDAWWILLALPIFFGLGWFAARIDLKDLLAQSKKIPELYCRGLNFLLNQQQDQAVDAFSELAAAQDNVVELQFALGSLLRRKGELEKAIKLHQALLVRADLSAEEQERAQYELGQDYLKAGIFDRAEAQFNLLLQSDKRQQALLALLHVYQLGRKWQDAISVAQQIDTLGVALQVQVAQFYCEQAEVAARHQQFAQAHLELQQALAVNPRCIRALLIQGRLHAQVQAHQAALNSWHQIADIEPASMALVGAPLLQAYQALGQLSAGIHYVHHLITQQGVVDLQDSLAVYLEPTQQHLLTEQLLAAPSLQTAALYLERTAPSLPDPQAGQAILKAIQYEYKKSAMYRCTRCGFRSQLHFWHCPACAEWESMAAKRGA